MDEKVLVGIGEWGGVVFFVVPSNMSTEGRAREATQFCTERILPRLAEAGLDGDDGSMVVLDDVSSSRVKAFLDSEGGPPEGRLAPGETWINPELAKFRERIMLILRRGM